MVVRASESSTFFPFRMCLVTSSTTYVSSTTKDVYPFTRFRNNNKTSRSNRLPMSTSDGRNVLIRVLVHRDRALFKNMFLQQTYKFPKNAFRFTPVINFSGRNLIYTRIRTACMSTPHISLHNTFLKLFTFLIKMSKRYKNRCTRSFCLRQTSRSRFINRNFTRLTSGSFNCTFQRSQNRNSMFHRFTHTNLSNRRRLKMNS